MRLRNDLHLAYCTNIHRGETWEEILAGLEAHTLRVKAIVSPNAPYAIGLRLGAQAAQELNEPRTLTAFQRWLELHQCYVFTVNGFPYGQFHGARIKEQVYRPDWTTTERLTYTNQLFDLIGELVPKDVQGSVSTCPGSFKAFQIDASGEALIRKHLHACCQHIEAVAARTGKDLHLGLEPEPLCYVETSAETVELIERVFADHPMDEAMLRQRLGVNYDTCHLAVEYETAAAALDRIEAAKVRLSKIHLSSALRLAPTPAALKRLRAFGDDTYLHQVIVKQADHSLDRFQDLQLALDWTEAGNGPGEEWRVHFHIPLHHEPGEGLQSTADHLTETLDWLQRHPNACSHLEMETYTWEVLPEMLRQVEVVDQLTKEYDWCLDKLRARELA
jgi:hypothetical protein